MSNPSAINPASEAARARATCPGYTPTARAELGERGVNDAIELADDVRNLDPREVWGRLALMATEDPTRLVAMALAAAAMLPDPSTTTTSDWRGLLEWTEPFVESPIAA